MQTGDEQDGATRAYAPANGKQQNILQRFQSFATARSLAEFLHSASREQEAVITGTKGRVPPGAAATALVYADLSDMCEILSLSAADQVVQVQSGLTVGQLNLMLQANKLWWPVSAEPGAKILDVIASGDGGPLEHRYGGPRDLVLGLSYAGCDGKVINCGGRVVKNVTGYDMTRLLVGARSWLGVVVSAHLRLYALPVLNRTYCFVFAQSQAALSAARTISRSGLPLACLELFNGELLLQSKMCQGLSNKLVSPGDLILAVQIQGMPEVVAEVAGQLKQLLSETVAEMATATMLDDQSQDELWAKLSASSAANYQDDDCPVEIACSLPQLLSLLDLLPEGVKTAFQARPWRGRAKVTVGPGRSPLVLEAAAKHASDSQPLTLGFADDCFNYRVKRLPEGGQTMTRLLQRIKDEFDPAYSLNPFVSL